MIHMSRILSRLLLVPLFLIVATAIAEEKDPSGTVAVETTSVAAGVGVQWGDGTLTFKGEKYPFSLQGVQLLDVGYAKVSAEGKVYGLSKLSDFEGVYAAAEAGVAVGSGPATVTMRNPNGVTIYLNAVQEGAKLTLAAEGVEIKLKEKGAAS
ncbi:MAG: hypothetical protein ACRERD_11175 [Candidatus Binatia bacterium]